MEYSYELLQIWRIIMLVIGQTHGGLS